MGKASRRHNGRYQPKATRTRSAAPLLGVAAAVFVAAVGTVLLLSGNSADPDSGASVGADAAALQRIGGTNEMGFPYVSTPGSARGQASAEGVSVHGAVWALGHVPLSVAVLPEWTLTNTGSSAVRLGQPHAEVRAGCCPGPFTLATNKLAPGESTTLTFELAMHEGMDGWHDIGVYVPVVGQAGARSLALRVTGDFSD